VLLGWVLHIVSAAQPHVRIEGCPGSQLLCLSLHHPYRSPVRSDQKSRQAHPIYLGSFTCMRLLASLCCMYSALAARILPQEANRIRPNGPPVAPAHIKPNPVLPCGRLTCVLHRCPACVPQASFYERPHAVGSTATLQHARLTPPRCPCVQRSFSLLHVWREVIGYVHLLHAAAAVACCFAGAAGCGWMSCLCWYCGSAVAGVWFGGFGWCSLSVSQGLLLPVYAAPGKGCLL
jgi:hypothetical protein